MWRGGQAVFHYPHGSAQYLVCMLVAKILHQMQSTELEKSKRPFRRRVHQTAVFHFFCSIYLCLEFFFFCFHFTFKMKRLNIWFCFPELSISCPHSYPSYQVTTDCETLWLEPKKIQWDILLCLKAVLTWCVIIHCACLWLVFSKSFAHMP